MTDATDYDPVGCPVSDCAYRDAVRSVAAHVAGADDDAHAWDRLGYAGARDFVETEKRRQRQQGGAGGGSSDGASSSPNDGRSTGDGDSTGGTATDGTATAEEDEQPFELGFERDALVLLELAREYDLSSLEDLGTWQLADLYSLLADLKNSADDARQEVRDELLEHVSEDRTIPADLGSVSRTTYTVDRSETRAPGFSRTYYRYQRHHHVGLSSSSTHPLPLPPRRRPAGTAPSPRAVPRRPPRRRTSPSHAGRGSRR